MKLRKVPYLLFIIVTICLITSCNKECKHQSTDWIIDVEATCTQNGSKHKECTVCHEKLDTEVIESLGHDLVHHEKEDPTCTKKGHKAYDTCTRCDYTTYEEIPELGHIYEDGICTRCGLELTTSDLLYELTSDNAGYIVTGLDYSKYDINALTIIIPSEYKGLPIVGIKEEAFKNRIKIKNVIISDNITHIGNAAFKGCQGLMNIEIPTSVTSIGSSAFSGCTGLTSITLPFIGNGINKTHFGYIFGADYSSDNSKYVPTSLKKVIITGGKSIGSSAFYGCTSLTSIEIPTSVTSIGSYTFHNCTGLTSIVIPDSVTSIGSSAFEGCTSLTSIEIPTSVTSIGSYAFEGCTGLTSIVIPNSVTSIGYSAFYGCNSLTYNIYDNCKYLGNDENPYLVLVEATNTSMQSISINPNTKIIGSSAFEGCTSLTSIEIPNSVTSIGDSAFSGCIGLTSIEIPNSVTSIGDFAFYGCTGLTSILIPNSVTSIGKSAFYSRTGLTIYCEASEKPSGWQSSWSSSNCKVVWGYKKN